MIRNDKEALRSAVVEELKDPNIDIQQLAIETKVSQSLLYDLRKENFTRGQGTLETLLELADHFKIKYRFETS